MVEHGMLCTLAALVSAACLCAGLEPLPSTGFDCSVHDTLTLSSLRRRGAALPPVPNRPPFVLYVLDEHTQQRVTRYEAGKTYIVLVYSQTGPFVGVELQARVTDESAESIGGRPVGLFVVDRQWPAAGVKPHTGCSSLPSAAVTHADATPKSLLKLKWTAPDHAAGPPIQFVAVLSIDPTTYWEDWRPATGFLRSKGAPPGRIVFTQRRTTPTTTTSSTSTTTTTARSSRAPTPAIITGLPPSTAGPGRLSTRRAFTFSNLQRRPAVAQRRQAAKGQPQTAAPVWPGHAAPKKQQSAPSKLIRSVDPSPSAIIQQARAAAERSKNIDNDPDLRFRELRLVGSTYIIPPGRADRVNTSVLVADPCRSFPCYYGAQCRWIDGPVRVAVPQFYCQCKPGYTGLTCKERDPCDKVDCGRHGKCVLEGKETECVCDIDWTGDRCHQHCPAYICRNGGVCQIDRFQRYVCKCPAGFSGNRCDDIVDECRPRPCRNGGRCIDGVNDYQCLCAQGWAGKSCDKPCQDVYEHCKQWAKQRLCDEMRNYTTFYDEHCPRSCGLCQFSNDTVSQELIVPEQLKPFLWLLGEWRMDHSYDARRFPLDFPKGNREDDFYYRERLRFSIADSGLFGAPALHFESIGKSIPSTAGPDTLALVERAAVYRSNGYLTWTSMGRQPVAMLVATSSDGMTTIEHGTARPNELSLRAVYVGGPQHLTERVPVSARRTFAIDDKAFFMSETIDKIDRGNAAVQSVKYYRRHNQVEHDDFPLTFTARPAL